MAAPGKEIVTVVGAGLMGHGIAQVFAARGHNVRLVDADPQVLDTAKGKVRGNLLEMAEHGIQLGDSVDSILDRITLTTDLSASCEACDFVIEAVYEDLELKQRVFADLDRHCPQDAILCSNTSVIRITEIAQGATRRERILGTHFWNPPYLIPAVEVVRTEETADWCFDTACEVLRRAGKHPVRVHKDVPGFVGNRLQHALWREAFAIIDQGICEPATVDEVIRNAFGLRLPVMGPVETADMIGLDLTLAIHDYLLQHLNADPTPSSTLRSRVQSGELGFKTGSGFQRWTEAEMASSRQRLRSHLMETLAAQQAAARKEGAGN